METKKALIQASAASVFKIELRQNNIFDGLIQNHFQLVKCISSASGGLNISWKSVKIRRKGKIFKAAIQSLFSLKPVTAQYSTAIRRAALLIKIFLADKEKTKKIRKIIMRKNGGSFLIADLLPAFLPESERLIFLRFSSVASKS